MFSNRVDLRNLFFADHRQPEVLDDLLKRFLICDLNNGRNNALAVCQFAATALCVDVDNQENMLFFQHQPTKLNVALLSAVVYGFYLGEKTKSSENRTWIEYSPNLSLLLRHGKAFYELYSENQTLPKWF